MVQIIDLQSTNENLIRQAASLLVEGFPPTAWPDIASGLEEVDDLLKSPENVVRVAINEQEKVLGWVGALSEYDGNTWQLHPLVVHPTYQGQGIGTALVRDLERLAHARGVTTIYLGTDDDHHMTSLSDVDLYPDMAGHITSIQNLRHHPFEFYQKVGFVIVGLIPDANGPGKPDIIMAKRVTATEG